MLFSCVLKRIELYLCSNKEIVIIKLKFKIMKQQNESVRELEIGKDYVSVLYSKFIVIDRAGDFNNEAIYDDLYRKEIPCANCATWIEATEEEVIEAFKRHLVHRYGKDWMTMKIKEMHPNATSDLDINDASWKVEISKHSNGWNVWNNNGLLYRNGIWVERLEEEMEAGKEIDKCIQLKREVLTILSVESKLNPDKKISEYLEQFKLILEVL